MLLDLLYSLESLRWSQLRGCAAMARHREGGLGDVMVPAHTQLVLLLE